MADQEEKRIIVKVAYNYFHNEKWDRALEEYKKLIAIDPMDFLVHNMMAEIYLRKDDKANAIDEYLKAASLLRATNNLEKAIHAYNHVLKLDPENEEAKAKTEESVKARLIEVDEFIRRNSLKNAYELCDHMLTKIPDHPLLKAKMLEIQELEKKRGEKGAGTQPPSLEAGVAISPREETLNKDEVVKNLYAMAERYEQKQSWDEAVEAYITILRFLPDDDMARIKLRELYQKITRQDKAAEVWSRIRQEKQKPVEQAKITISGAPESAPSSAPLSSDAQKSGLESTVSEMEKLCLQAEGHLRQSVEDRREREKQKSTSGGTGSSSAEGIPAEEGNAQDIRVFLTQTQMYIHQNLLVEAMRLCQRILELDSQNKEVRGLLKQIYDKKNL